ncbi:hypothetical protein WR25_03512 isoform B [Diploscapter pachys]|uniref:G-protein coupled receptors family 1 profile domain-containing protein n=2 Tax=Diploscapter pachys TaxID=2018661 RepID=A0A2A2JC85_9BILA|nr:hypothetical protein WR25_03512 isoform B [Diploscapter pachys]
MLNFRMKIEKCTVDIESFMFTAFTIYQFVLCYCVPLLLIAFFYTKLLRKLSEHARSFKSSHIPLMRIAWYTMAVACFYFLCWTPFWMATVFAVYLENTEYSEQGVPAVFVYVMYFIHALPFTNSAINWILYGALNGQLQQRYRSGKAPRSIGNNNAYRNNDRTMVAPSSGMKTSPNHINGNGLSYQQMDAAPSTMEEYEDDVDIRLLPCHEPTYL